MDRGIFFCLGANTLTAQEALAQIKDKSYILPFELNGQQIVRIGLNFDKVSRNIEKCVWE